MQLYEFINIAVGPSGLHGLRTQSSYGRTAIHSHGTWGNFYENAFSLDLSSTYIENHWTYASVNNSGHDLGSMHEDFDASLPEISAWASLLCPSGEALILQGHSSGALKILQLLHDPKYVGVKRRVAAAVLLSPFDIVAFNGGIGAARDERRAKAEEIRVKHGGDMPVGKDIFEYWPISADTYLEATNAGGRWDLFPTRDGQTGALSSTGVPTFVAIGSEDFASYPNGKAVAELVAKKAPEVKVALIEGAPHNFAGYEIVLAEKVDAFLRTLAAT